MQRTPWIKACASLHNKNPDTANVPGIWMKTNLHPLHGSPCSLPTMSAWGTAQHQRATTSQTGSQRREPAPVIGVSAHKWQMDVSNSRYTAKHAYVERLTGSRNENEFSLPAWCRALTVERQGRRFAAGSTHMAHLHKPREGSLPSFGDLTPFIACSEFQ